MEFRIKRSGAALIMWPSGLLGDGYDECLISMNRRVTVLIDLLNASRPVDVLVKELTEFGWDSSEELVTLDRIHVTNMLEDYLAERRAAAEIHAWAEAIEGRDDIGFSKAFHDELKNAIFQLANPELTYSFSPLLARRILGMLRP